MPGAWSWTARWTRRPRARRWTAATRERRPLAGYLLEKKLIAPADLAAANSVEFGMPIFDVASLDPTQSAIKLVSEELVRKHAALPLFKRGGRLFVGVADPTNTRALDEIKFHTNLAVEAILVDEDRIKRTIDQWLEPADALADAVADGEGLESLEVSGGDEDLDDDSGVDAKGDDTPVVKFINKVLLDAIRRGASDIHFEPYETDYRVRLRIDGMLKEVAKPPVQAAATHRRAPEGHGAAGHRREARAAGRPHQAQPVARPSRSTSASARCRRCSARRSCCVSSMPARPSSASTSSATRKTRRSCSSKRVQKPHGMVLVTGPTGSGKTVSLYTGAQHPQRRHAQHLHRRGPGRNPPARHQPGAA